MEIKTDIAEEKRILVVAIIVAILFFVLNTAIAVISKSLSMTINVVYIFLDICLIAVSIRWLEKLFVHPNQTYNFGYFKLEPFLVVIQCLFLVVICVTGLITAVLHIIHSINGGLLGIRAYGITISFTSFSVVFCLIMWRFAKRIAKKSNSAILHANELAYKVDFYMNLFLFLGFVIGYFLEKEGLFLASRLTDPILSILICMFLIKEIASLLSGNLKDLLDVSPGKDLEKEILFVTDRFLMEKCSLDGDAKIKLRRAGRRLFATLYYRVDQEMRFLEIERINHRIKEHLLANFPSLIVTCYPELRCNKEDL